MTNLRNFSVVQAGGHQYILQAGRWYDLNFIQSEPGDIVKLQRVLYHQKDDKSNIGNPCITGKAVVGVVLQHFKGKKTCVFKYKPKKKYTRKKGYRPYLTRVLIKNIFEKTN